MLKKIAVLALKSSIYVLILALMFSTVSLEFSKVASGTLSDIFYYASDDAKNEIINVLIKSCPNPGRDSITLFQICSNETILTSMRKDCTDFRKKEISSLSSEYYDEMNEKCSKIENGGIEKSCRDIESKENAYMRVGELCNSYSSGNITKNEFFDGFVETSFIMSDFKNPKIGVLSKYEKVVESINQNIILAAVLIIVLCLVLYLLINDIKIFLIAMAGIFFSIGLFIMIPYSAISIYQKTVGIDTTPLLKTMLGKAAEPQPREIMEIMTLIILRTYSKLLILLGTVSLAIGIIGKFMKHALKKRMMSEKK